MSVLGHASEPAAATVSGKGTVRPNGSAGPVTVGIVGLGYWGPNLLRVLDEVSCTEVRWICDTDRGRLTRFGREYPAVAVADDIAILLADPGLEAVCIATPIPSHASLVRRVLLAGKHCFVEKPLALSSAEADELCDLAASGGVTLMCDFTFLHSAAVRRVRELIVGDVLGEVLFLSSERARGMHQRAVSVLWDLAPHDFSILLYWMGSMPEAILATGRDSVVEGVPDVAFITMRFASGMVANISTSWLAPNKVRRSVIVGTKKMVVYDDCHADQVRLYDHGVVYQDEIRGRYDLFCAPGSMEAVRLGEAEPLAVEVAALAASVRDGRAPRRWFAEMARDVVKLAEAAQRSWTRGGTWERVGVGTGAAEPAGEAQLSGAPLDPAAARVSSVG